MTENPYSLVLIPDGPTVLSAHLIDLDEPGWLTTWADELAHPGIWMLVNRETARIPVSMHAGAGDRPSYLARHFGILGGPEIVAYSIGKIAWDHDDEMRLWVLPNGQVCGNEDAEFFAGKLLAEIG